MNNIRGMSLVEVVIVMGLTTIGALAMSSMMAQNARQMKYVGQKMNSFELQNLMLTALADGTVCSKVMQDAVTAGTPYEFNRTDLAAAVVNLTSLPMSVAPGAPPLVQAGATGSSGLEIANPPLTFDSFQANGTNSFIANLNVKFVSSSMPMPIRFSPIRFFLTTDGTTPLAKILSCGVSGTSASPFSGSYVDVRAARAFNVNYTNTSSGPKFVTVTAASTSPWSQKAMNAVVNGVYIQRATVTDANSSMGWLANHSQLSFMVPPGQTYLVNPNIGSMSIIYWMELN